MILDGKKVSEEICLEIKNKIQKNQDKFCLAIIWVGNNESNKIYVNHKIEKCKSVGIKTILYHLKNDVMEFEIINLINKLNNDNEITGILLQSPVPSHININNCFANIKPQKDIEGFSNISLGNLQLHRKCFIPCTPKGIIRLLDYYNIDLKGKNVCLINNSLIVGRPLFQLLIDKGATVTMAHSQTKNISFFTKNADVIISAVGKPKFITKDMVKNKAIIIDVGITRINNRVIGDVDFENVLDKASYITPVPGGVGPMTIAMVLENILETKKED